MTLIDTKPSAELVNKTLFAKLDFTKVYVGDVEELRQKLYPWMLAQGYPVTSTMTLKQLIIILVGESAAKFYVTITTLFVEDTEDLVEDDTLTIKNGGSYADNILYLEDTE